MDNYDNIRKKFYNAVSELNNLIYKDKRMGDTRRRVRIVFWILIAALTGAAILIGKETYQRIIYENAVSEYENNNISTAAGLFSEIDYKNSGEWLRAVSYELGREAYLEKDFETAARYLKMGDTAMENSCLRCFALVCLGRRSWNGGKYDSALSYYTNVLRELEQVNESAISRERISKTEDECYYYIGRISYDKGNYVEAVEALSKSSYSDAEDRCKLAEESLRWSSMGLKAEPVKAGSLRGYNRYLLDSSMITQSSYLVQSDGRENLGWCAFDGDMDTTWQEGVEGAGHGEFLAVDFGSQLPINAVSFKVGNWRSDFLHEENNVPAEIEVEMDGHKFSLEFSREMQEYAVFFPEPVLVSKVKFTIINTYPGSVYNDTVISDIGFYGT